MMSADEITDALTEAVLDDLDLDPGQEVLTVVNGMGGTPQMELFVVNRRLQELLGEREVETWDSWVGDYMTSLDMAGASITVCAVDDELKELLGAPADTRVHPDPMSGNESGGDGDVSGDHGAAVVVGGRGGRGTHRGGARLPHRTRLRHRGRGPRRQHGARVGGRRRRAARDLDDPDPETVCKTVGKTLMAEVGGASGPCSAGRSCSRAPNSTRGSPPRARSRSPRPT